MKLEEYLLLHPKKYLIFDLDETLALLHINWSTITQGIFDLVATFDEPLTKEIFPSRYSVVYLLSNRAIKNMVKWPETK